MFENLDGYAINGFRVLILSIFCLYHYISKRYNCFLYLFIFLIGFLSVFLWFRERFVNYSGIALLFFGAIAIILGNKDWNHFRQSGITAYKLFFSDNLDRLVLIVAVFSIIAPVFLSRIF